VVSVLDAVRNCASYLVGSEREMIKDDIITMANKVYGDYDWSDQMISRLSQFAELVAEREREACAQVCEDLIGTRAMARHCADHIRAMGKNS
jgi:hypothetical protein